MSPAETRVGSSSSRPLLPLLLVNFIGTLGFSIVMPFLIFLVTRWGGNALVYGVIGATYSTFQFVGAPILGRWSDRYGRRRILLLSQAGTAVSWLILLTAFALPTVILVQLDTPLVGQLTLSLPLLVLFVARAADGLTGGNISVANAYLADITPEKERSANFGKMAVSSSLGFVVGPALAGLLGATALGELVPVILAASVSLGATLLIAFRLPESNPCELSSEPDAANASRVFGKETRSCLPQREALSLLRILRLDRIPLLLTLSFLILLAFNLYYIGFPVFVANQLRWTVKDTGAFFATMSLLMIVVQGPVLSRASKHWRESVLVVVGAATLAVGFLLFAFRSAAILYAGAAVLALGNGLMWPSLVAILSKQSGAHQGAVQGVSGSSGAIASVVGLILGGILYGVLQERLFILSAALVFIVALMSLRLLGWTEVPAAAESKSEPAV